MYDVSGVYREGSRYQPFPAKKRRCYGRKFLEPPGLNGVDQDGPGRLEAGVVEFKIKFYGGHRVRINFNGSTEFVLTEGP